MKIEFVLSPVGRFGLAFAIGSVAELESEKAQELIDAGYAVLTKEGKEESEIEMAVIDSTVIEKAEKKRTKK